MYDQIASLQTVALESNQGSINARSRSTDFYKPWLPSIQSMICESVKGLLQGQAPATSGLPTSRTAATAPISLLHNQQPTLRVGAKRRGVNITRSR